MDQSPPSGEQDLLNLSKKQGPVCTKVIKIKQLMVIVAQL